MTVEVELKLAIARGDAVRLRKHPLLKALKPSRRKLYGIYFDTPEFELYRQHGAFRLRREGYHWVQTLKLDSGASTALSVRPEWEVQVTGNQPDISVLPEVAQKHLTPELFSRLQPAFVTDFQRTIWLLERPEGTVEIALDAGHIRAGENTLPISELELELKSGDSRLLIDVALELLDAAPMLPEYRSKALRGYQLAGVWQQKPCRQIAVDMADRPSAAEAWRRMLLAGHTQLSRNLPGFLHENDPEYLHQMRVAIRRMRTVLSLGRRIGLARDDWASELRWFMGELSPARDWDVMVTETLAAVQAELPAIDRLDTLITEAERRRAAARDRAWTATTEPRLTRLLLSMTKGLITEMTEGPKLKDWAVAALNHRLRQFGKLAGNFDQMDAAGRHQLRIAAKHLRYAGEAYAPLHGDKAVLYLARVTRLQNGLGAANDVAVAHGLLAEVMNKDRKLAHAAGLVEGFIVAASIGQVRSMAKLVAEIQATPPFWRQGKHKAET
jgi:inorganic triphosphatase YgiF